MGSFLVFRLGKVDARKVFSGRLYHKFFSKQSSLCRDSENRELPMKVLAAADIAEARLGIADEDRARLCE
jgi:hypothetical protein